MHVYLMRPDVPRAARTPLTALRARTTSRGRDAVGLSANCEVASALCLSSFLEISQAWPAGVRSQAWACSTCSASWSSRGAAVPSLLNFDLSSPTSDSRPRLVSSAVLSGMPCAISSRQSTTAAMSSAGMLGDMQRVIATLMSLPKMVMRRFSNPTQGWGSSSVASCSVSATSSRTSPSSGRWTAFSHSRRTREHVLQKSGVSTSVSLRGSLQDANALSALMDDCLAAVLQMTTALRM